MPEQCIRCGWMDFLDSTSMAGRRLYLRGLHLRFQKSALVAPQPIKQRLLCVLLSIELADFIPCIHLPLLQSISMLLPQQGS